MKRVQSIMLSSSIINTSVFFTRDASTVPFSNELLPDMSIFKKLWIVVPFIRDAATPLGASLVTTKLQSQIFYHGTHHK